MLYCVLSSSTLALDSRDQQGNDGFPKMHPKQAVFAIESFKN